MLAYLRFNNRDYEGHRIMNRLIIIGASGHGKVVADIAEKSGYSDIVFLDNNPKLITCAGYPVIGPDMMASELEGDLFIAFSSGAAGSGNRQQAVSVQRNRAACREPAAGC